MPRGTPSPAASAATTRPRTQRLESSKRSRPRRARSRRLGPVAARGQRARLAARRARRAHRRAELHRRLVEVRRASRRRDERRPQPREEAPRVGVQRHLLAPERERADRGGGVRADARQLLQARRPAVARHHPRRLPQAHGAAVVAEPHPLAQHVLQRRRRQRVGGGPARQPRLVARDHPRDLRLLEHDLRDEDRVGVAGAPPRQVAALALVPAQQPRGPIGGHGGEVQRTVRRGGRAVLSNLLGRSWVQGASWSRARSPQRPPRRRRDARPRGAGGARRPRAGPRRARTGPGTR